VAADSYVGTDSAMAFSWHGVALAPGATVVKSFIVRFGGFETSAVALSLTAPGPGSTVHDGAAVAVSARAEASPPPSFSEVKFVLVIDANATGFVELGEFPLGHEFSVSVDPAAYGLTAGTAMSRSRRQSRSAGPTPPPRASPPAHSPALRSASSSPRRSLRRSRTAC
jgi:hypothetical protein